jgi:DNA (cytosine-5)-methyltransferase 1
MKALSVCSGIGAPECAWAPLGFDFVAQSEIEPFPSRVLAHHFPTVPNVGDMTRISDGSVAVPAFDVLVGGTPCQSFSIAGLRGGLDDPRGNLALSFCQIAARYRPEWVVWENVPGVLSSDDGRAFGSILGALVELGYGLAWRVLDAQSYGVPQRRRRVFLVGHSGGSADRARSVLFEPEGVRGDPAPGREAREGVAGGAAVCATGSRTHALTRSQKGATEDGTGRGTPIIAFPHTQTPVSGAVSPCLSKNMDGMGVLASGPVAHAVTCHAAKSGDPTTDNYAIQAARVRRLTPLECERLQGFPDGWTDIPGAKDSPRYKAIGNSMAVPVLRWIGQRILCAT